MAPWLILLAVTAAYANSLSVPFLFDDARFLREDVPLLGVQPWWALLLGTTRPLARGSLLLNYALGGSHVIGYHLVNLAIHTLAALTLFGVLRRTLLTPTLATWFGSSARGLALVTALAWALHPLQTQSITYLAQRAESLMGLWYLLSLYAVIRGTAAARSRHWYGAAIGACALGMATKPVMVTAPLAIVLYDRVFLSGSFRRAWQQRSRVYLGLAATWGILGILLSRPNDSTTSAGFGVSGISPLSYALAQPGVLLHYLRLVVWPHPLVLDYAWPPPRSAADVVPAAIVIAGLLAATLWALRPLDSGSTRPSASLAIARDVAPNESRGRPERSRGTTQWSLWLARGAPHRPPLGFLGAWWFLILAPTSSLIPIADRAFEHRLYLPLAAVAALVVCAGYRLLRTRRGLAMGLAVALVGVLGAATMRRNHDYRSEIAIWTDTVVKRPKNPRAHYNLGKALATQGAYHQAIARFAEALRLQPSDADAHYNLGLAYAKLGQDDAAIAHYEEALRLNPTDAEARHNLDRLLPQRQAGGIARSDE